MANTQIFSSVVATGLMPADVSNRTVDARTWLRDKAQDVKRIDTLATIRKNSSNLQNKVMVGHMYMFYYDPKMKDDLPFYDRFPLIFPFRRVKDGFYGINMHYLPYMMRAKLMDQLYKLVSNQLMDETTKLRLSYKILSASAQFRYFQPCVKHYLNSNVKSRFLYIHPTEWDVALFLPTERFVKATKQTVFNETRRVLNIR